MQLSNIPVKFPIPWANAAGGGYIRPIPTASQIGITAGAASLTDGFPPLNFDPISSGGVPPFGQDFNGILKQITQWNQWQQAGGPIPYDGTFQSAIGGYPQGAIVASVLFPGLLWRSTADNNSTNPDAAGAGWTVAQRIALGGAANFYVATTGNDTTGNGTSGAPWATPQHAINMIQQLFDLSNNTATINLGTGTFGQFSVTGPFVGQTGPGNLVITGVGSSTIITGTQPATASNAGMVQIEEMELQGSTINVQASTASQIALGTGVVSAGAPNFHINAITGATIRGTGGLTISASAEAWAATSLNGSIVIDGQTITFTGAPNWSNAGVFTQMGYIQLVGNTYSGSATGHTLSSTYNGVVDTQDSFALLPGSTGPVTSNGGEYL